MNEFERLATDQANRGFFSDYWYFVRQNKKYWLIPLLILLLALGGLTLLSSTAASPFIYMLF